MLTAAVAIVRANGGDAPRLARDVTYDIEIAAKPDPIVLRGVVPSCSRWPAPILVVPHRVGMPVLGALDGDRFTMLQPEMAAFEACAGDEGTEP